MSNTSSSSGGTSILGLLGIAFVVLKLTGVINWSWWYVTLPFWGGLVIAVVILLAVVGYGYVTSVIKNRKWQKRMNEIRREDSIEISSPEIDSFHEKISGKFNEQRYTGDSSF